MKVNVNSDMCEGHGKCEAQAPEVFKVDENDKSRVLIPEPGEELWAKVRNAHRLCPRQAVIIEE